MKLRCILSVFSCLAAWGQNWPQWGQNPQHTGMVSVAGQRPERVFADILYDPIAEESRADNGGDVLTHYQAPVVDGTDLFMLWKTGAWISCANGVAPCGSGAWNWQTWNVQRWSWTGD